MKTQRTIVSIAILSMLLLSRLDVSARPAPTTGPARSGEVIPDPADVGGEPQGMVQVGNLIYAGTKTSKCFSDHFLLQAERDTTISTTRHFHPVRLGDEEVFGFPLIIMTGEGEFELTDAERNNLKQYVENGGMVLASASCSSPEWDRSLRAELARVLPAQALSAIPMDHPLFHTVYDIETLNAKHGEPKPLEGISLGGRLVVIYSQEGLNNTANTQGCCCCGGNEITNCEQVNVNILAYALTH